MSTGEWPSFKSRAWLKPDYDTETLRRLNRTEYQNSIGDLPATMLNHYIDAARKIV